MMLEQEVNGTADRQPYVTPFQLASGYHWFNALNSSYSQYVFLDVPSNQQAAHTIGYFYSNRSITTDAKCNWWPVTNGNGGSGNIDYGDDTGDQLTANFTKYSPNSTTYKVGYYYDNEGSCGPRCGAIMVFENNGIEGNYFECNVTVSKVANITTLGAKLGQDISDETALFLAQSIALQGFTSIDATTDEPVQEQRYPKDFLYGTFINGSAQAMELLLRTFAIGAITATDALNPYAAPVMDLIPLPATSLGLDHPNNIRGMLFGIVAGHLILLTIGLILANRVVVPDESALSSARVLRPVVDKLGTQGSLLNGEEISERLGDPMMVYGPSVKQRRGAGGVLRHIEISEKAEVVEHYSGWKGKYD